MGFEHSANFDDFAADPLSHTAGASTPTKANTTNDRFGSSSCAFNFPYRYGAIDISITK